MSPYIPTYTGKLFHILEPDPSNICIEDIAHSLSYCCRFTGHTKFHYSVAAHSIMVSMLVPPVDELWGLLHDASEAYIQDISRPLKYSGLMTGYLELEKRMQNAVCDRFGLPHDEPESVHLADNIALATEFRDVMYAQERGLGLPPSCGVVITEAQPADVERRFLRKFYQLYGDRS